MSHESPSKKRPRTEEAAPATTAPAVQALHEQFAELSREIAEFRQAHMEISARIAEQKMRADMRAMELNLGMFSPAEEPFSGLVITALELLFEQSAALNAAYQLNSDIHACQNRVSSDEQCRLNTYRQKLTDFIIFVGQELHQLFHIYETSKDNFLKGRVRQKLGEDPALESWVSTFISTKGEDPLMAAVDVEVKRQRTDAIEILKGAFDFEIEEKLTVLTPTIEAMLEKLENFEERREKEEFQRYADQVTFYAVHCVETLKDTLDVIRRLNQLARVAETIIQKIQGLDETADISDLLKTLMLIQEWHNLLMPEVNAIYRPMRTLVELYEGNSTTLPDNLIAFMKPWRDPEHPNPLPAAIYAYENPQYFPETREVTSAEPKVSNFRRNHGF